MRRWMPISVIVLSVAMAGCRPQLQSASAPSQVTPSSTVPVPAGASDTPEVKVQIAGREAYDALLEKHRGKVVLVDFWGTWCPPCLKQFPHTVELSKKHEADGLAVISVAMEILEDDTEEKTLKFLQEQEATFDNLISKYGIGVDSAVEFEVGCDGALPFYKLYDRQGKLRFQFCSDPQGEEGIYKTSDLDAKLAELLAETAE